MESMNQGGREKGYISGETKFKSLMGKLFTFNKQKKQEKPKVLDRGSIVTLGDTMNTRYIISIFRNKCKKWHISLIDDNPSWKIIEKEA